MCRRFLAGTLTVLIVSLFAAGAVLAQELTAQLCKDKAIAAAKLLEAEGEAAYDALKDPAGEFRFAGGAGYVWVQTTDGTVLMHPIKPSLDGQDLSQKMDANGVQLFAEFGKMAKANGAGWVAYVWPKPGEEAVSPKISYVVLAQHGGVDYVVGCGLYDVTVDDIMMEFPDDPAR
jgi:methyl-accepting chemotaxis protein